MNPEPERKRYLIPVLMMVNATDSNAALNIAGEKLGRISETDRWVMLATLAHTLNDSLRAHGRSERWEPNGAGTLWQIRHGDQLLSCANSADAMMDTTHVMIGAGRAVGLTAENQRLRGALEVAVGLLEAGRGRLENEDEPRQIGWAIESAKAALNGEEPTP